MASNYPDSLDSFSDPTNGNLMNQSGYSHSGQHANANDAIKAIEQFVGTTGNPGPALAGYATMTTKTWAASTVYAKNQLVQGSNGTLLQCTAPGESGATEPTWPTTPGDTVNDGTLTWLVLSVGTGAYAGILVPSGDTSGITDVTQLQAALNAGDVTLKQGGQYYWNRQVTHPASSVLNLNGATITLTSGLTASALKGAAAVHQGSKVLGPGTIDATAVTSNTVTAVVDFSAVTSCPNLVIDKVRVVNAPTHGIFVSESTKTTPPKWVTGCSVEGYHKVSGGYGIYADYIGNITIGWNHVEGGGGDDAIELGHSGIRNLGIIASMLCIGNTVKDGEINFPFSDGAQIIDNQVDVSGYAGLGGIGNDGNTANNVLIQGNTVRGVSCTTQTPAGIWITGDSGRILDNDVQVTVNSAIPIQGGGYVLTNGEIAGNFVSTTAAALGGWGIGTGSANSSNLNVHDNHIAGNFNTGVQIQNPTVHLHHNLFSQSAGADTPWAVASGLNGAPILIEDNVILGSPGYVHPVGNISSTAGLIIRNNQGVNPLGVETVAVPASGTAVAAAYYDRTFYVTAGTSIVQMAVQGGPSPTIPASGFGTVLVPAGKTVTPTYTAAPSWVVEGQ